MAYQVSWSFSGKTKSWCCSFNYHCHFNYQGLSSNVSIHSCESNILAGPTSCLCLLVAVLRVRERLDLMHEGLVCNTWRFWALWGDSGPGPSCVSPGVTPVRCAASAPNGHFILARWIFKPWMFLQILPHVHCLLIVVCPLPGSVTVVSVRLGCSSSPPLGHPWGYFSIKFIVGSYWMK